MVKHPPAMQETWVQFPGWEDPLEKGMASHSSILAWEIPGTEKPGGLHPTEPHRVRHDSATQHPQDPYKETRPQGKSGSRDLYATLT